MISLSLVAFSAVSSPTPTCDVCTLILTAVDNLAENSTSLARAIESLDKDCDKLFPPPSKLDKPCRALVNATVNLLPLIVVKGLDSIAWDAAATCAALGACEVPCCIGASDTSPEQLHLALGATSSSMVAMWTTLGSTNSAVQYGVSPTALASTSVGTSATYTNFGWRGQLHQATMTALDPDTVYYYQVGDEHTKSTVRSFRTLAADAGTDATPLRVVSIADMGYGNLSDDTVAAITRLATADPPLVDVIIHNGDVGYADGDMHHWDVFMRKIEPIASRVPYMVSPGNHEFWFNFTAFKKRFSMPSADEPDGMFYTFSIGTGVAAAVPAVRFISMDTESALDFAQITAPQLAWLKGVLPPQSSSAPTRPRWTMAYGHRPLYCSQTGGQDIPGGNKVLQGRVEATLDDGGVDIVVQGHVHDYERSLPMRNGQPVAMNYSSPTAPVYVVNGAAGNREDNDHAPGNAPWSPPGGVGRAHAVSYGVITITTSALKWEQIRSNDSRSIDEWTITK